MAAVLAGSNVMAQSTPAPTVNGNVYGGGNLATVGGNVTVNMRAGEVQGDVYGGGALANTNINNATNYGTSSETVTSTTANITTVNLTGGTIKGDAYGGGLGRIGVEAKAAVKYTQEEANAYNTEHGLSSGDEGFVTTETVKTPAVEGVDEVKALVYGNVSVTLGTTGNDATATAFYVDYYEGTHSDVVKSGRVFGCNNLNGYPLGNVTVTVNKTEGGNKTRTADTSLKEGDEGYAAPTYEVAAVYGGGNLANNTASGKKTNVIIATCDVSVKYVYGGGNAAAVPETDVWVKGAYEIQEVFGGGNGKDPYKLEGSDWTDNPGADVNGNVKTLITGGYIHEAYGGSNQKGTITGSVSIDALEDGTGACDMCVDKLVGAGKNADVNGDLIMVMGCKPSTKIALLFAGADNANVNGNVELTITSGNFGKVFGGNNESGAIRGHIKLNIEETGSCDTPIEIDDLYLGGNLAAYSKYGYYIETSETNGTGLPTETAVLDSDGRLQFKPRTSASDTHKPVKTYNRADNSWTVYSGSTGDVFTEYGEPELNVISCTRIGRVFGGGLGATAVMCANPTVNINMIPGSHASDINRPETAAVHRLGEIGDVFGGGNAADVYGNTTVNIGTATEVNVKSWTYDSTNDVYTAEDRPVEGAYITGNVYGGGNEADVKGNTAVNICAVNADNAATTDKIEYTDVTISGTGYEGVKVLGSVYGGGNLGSVGTFTYATTANNGKNPGAEVSTGVYTGMPTGITTDTGISTVAIMGKAEIGRNDMKMETASGFPDDWGHVFGASKGTVDPLFDDETEMTDAEKQTAIAAMAEAELNGKLKHLEMMAFVNKTDVTIGGNAFVKGSVYGGSENGHVLNDTHVVIADNCQIGNGFVQMDNDGNYLANPLSVNRPYTANEWSQKKLITTNDRDELKALVSTTRYTSSLPECASWKYGGATATADKYAPYDMYYTQGGSYDSKGGRNIGDDGHTFFGNVFGGGSGYYPYAPGKWLMSAGAVYGNTEVDITGGHILTNIYGGNEMTDVGTYETDSDGNTTTTVKSGGECTVNFGGTATLGVPRTLKQIDKHPVTCYLFGAGKGDQRVFFNKHTNVKDVEVNITGGTIYGSVFGGGEDGHVMRDVTMTIEGSTTKIGTWGTSYVDGNVFGGGRGFGGDAYTAGNVAGSVTMEINGGEILGSIYGGGRLGSVGYGLYTVSETDGYGKLRADDKMDDDADGSSFFTHGRGHINITISGGTIGNTNEYIVPNATNMAAAGIPEADRDISKWNDTNKYWDTWKTYHNISKTVFDEATGRLIHTKGGNVFAGGMGRREKLDGVTPIPYDEDDPESIDWHKLGNVKITNVTVSGSAWIKSNVYGGGELGAVRSYYEGTLSTPTKTEGGNTEVNINGGTIGTMIGPSITGGTKDTGNTSGEGRYTFGSVYGGGYGTEKDITTIPYTKDMEKFAAVVLGDAKVTMTNGTVLGSVFGGGEVACIGGKTTVEVKGGKVGVNEVSSDGNVLFGGATMGNVYGGGSGSKNAVNAGLVRSSTTVNISGSSEIYHSVYGGGAFGSVGWFTFTDGKPTACSDNTGTANVTITGGTIGINGHENGMVFGSSRGDVDTPTGSPAVDPNDRLAWVNNTHVQIGTAGQGTTLTTPTIKGTIYGSGENGHTFTNTVVDVHGGTIGIASGSPIGTYTEGGATYPYRGNVYGGGCGTDTYKYDSDNDGDIDNDDAEAFNPLAGIVYGNATINIDGGQVVRNVYGGGAMGSVGKTVTDNGVTTTTDGKTTINVSGGIVGVDGNNNGNVYGSSRGNEGISTSLANVMTSEVNIQTGADVRGSVFGGGEAGFVKGNVSVNMLGGSVGHDVYGGGALAHTNISNWGNNTWATGMYNSTTHATTYQTNVTLKGGTVGNNVYGGGLGSTAVEAKVYGDVLVKLNESETTGEGNNATTTYGNCVVKGNIFGCNNLNGSPQSAVTVHVYNTQGWTEGTGASAVSHDVSAGKSDNTVAKATGVYEVAAVYGGGNLAAYKPDLAATADTVVARIIIDGCNMTSIETVYGGGNAASVPATDVIVNGTYEIGQVFAGGNGKDNYQLDGKWYKNPGANVGYENYTHTEASTSVSSPGTQEQPYYLAVDNTDPDASTKEKRIANYIYGIGKAHATIYGGTVHEVYGGSNTKGNIRVEARATLQDAEGCSFNVGEAYGGGRNAPMDGNAVLDIECISGLGKAYGGAAEADVNGDVILNITNGTYGQVFGGNDLSGAIRGSITVNIEETGCRPVIIGELYAGGNKAPYSVYGYDSAGNPLKQGDSGASGTPVTSPQLNVKSFTSIGTIYGGGYGVEATMVGNPTVNINVIEGKYANTDSGRNTSIVNDNARVVGSRVEYSGTGYPVPSHEKGKIGAINNVFGGGNEAAVIGNPTVNIGTEAGEEVYTEIAVAANADVKGYYTRSGEGTTASPYTYTEITTTTTAVTGTTYYLKTVKGVDIRGNVYGGGNNAPVTGNTSVNIGKAVNL